MCVCVCVAMGVGTILFIHCYTLKLNLSHTIMKRMASNLSAYSSYCLKIKPEYYSSAEVNFLQFTVSLLKPLK